MSVLVTAVIEGDADKFRDSLVNRADDYIRISGEARAVGCLHHRFGIGDGFVLIEDEWESPEAFRRFFTREELQTFISEVGGDTSAEPVIVFAEPVASPDQF